MSKLKIKFTYGTHPEKGTLFDPQMDTTDQRAPLNDPETMYQQFVLQEQDLSELDDELISDFDNDLYEYEDRSEYGEDIARAQQAEFVKAARPYLSNRKKAERTSSKRSEES